MSLNAKQRKFVAEYMKDGNATQAAIRAGYSKRSAYSQAGDLLKKPEIRESIESAVVKVEQDTLVSVEYVINGIKEVAERCMQRVPVMVRQGNRMVQKVDEDGNHVWEFDSAGANKALENLGRFKKLFTDKVVVENSDELAEKLAAARARARK